MQLTIRVAMKLHLFVLAVVTATATALAVAPKEIVNPARQAKYVNGEIHMRIMNIKESTFARQREEGVYDSTQYSPVNGVTKCVNGYAAGYKCSNIDLYAYASHKELGSSTGEGSSSWGWTSDNGREIIIVAQVFLFHKLVL